MKMLKNKMDESLVLLDIIIFLRLRIEEEGEGEKRELYLHYLDMFLQEVYELVNN